MVTVVVETVAVAVVMVVDVVKLVIDAVKAAFLVAGVVSEISKVDIDVV